ncbi:MAG: DUF2357 domain-containing protein [Treponema sp.]|nr:DUF2357 domain-containing protein [Candidatus Treponema merdequi]
MKYSFIKINFSDVSLLIYDRYQKDLVEPNSIGLLDKNEVFALAADSGSIEFIPEPKNGFCSLRLSETQQYFVTLSDFTTEHSENYSINIKSEFEATEISKGIYSFKVINYLGKADFEILSDENIIHSVKLEIVPKKIDYEDDYVKLTEDIAEKCSALLLDYSSPTNLSFKNNNESARTPLEKFIFIRTFCNNDNIESLFYSIKNNPDSLLVSEDELKPFGTASVSRKFFSNPFANSRNWIETENHSYLPEYITATRKYDSLDTSANRFLKFAFNSFIEVCDEVIKFLGDKNLTYREEAVYIKENLELYLTESFFDDVQDLTSMPVNNQVLQKREGYAQIFNAFNMLDLAKQLDWKGENVVYEGQARNVALLYEYWLVFKFMEILKEIGVEIEFDLSDDDHKDRMFVKDNGLLVSLKEGKTSYFSALTKDKKFRIKFYYNRTFGKKDFEGTDYQGSYSRDFRPDYTLAIFPSAYKEEQAIKIGEVSFIHFDAKYRVTDITSLFGKENLDSEDFSEQKKDETINTYNRGDLFKMHTYNDAIRKTIGSYVLYPGTSNKENEFKVYDELLPGVGAFAIRPGDKENAGAEILKKFISDIIDFKSKNSTRQYRKDYFENMVIQSPSESNAAKINNESKLEYQMIGFVRNEYFSFLQENGNIPTSLEDFKSKNSFQFYFYFYAIKNGKVYTIHKETTKAKYLRITTSDIKDCKIEFGYKFQHLEPWEAEVDSIELVSKEALKEKLDSLYGENTFIPENGFHADYYYLAKAKVTRYFDSGITAINVSENEDISAYSPKVIPRNFESKYILDEK